MSFLSNNPLKYWLLLSLFALPEAAAQPPALGNQAPPLGNQVTLTQTVEPSFRIEPVVHRFSARRGEVIPFEFAISSLGKSMEVTVAPVNLRQEETGVILHDAHGEPATALRLTSPRSFKLEPGQQSKIEGQLTVPLALSNYLSYGILVREAGVKPDFNAAGEAETRAGIRFVTQYVLRVDVETGVADVSKLRELRIEEATLIDERGLPHVESYLRNPTDYAFECYVSAQFPRPGRRPTPLRLGMPSRATLSGDERHLIRIMPKSVLRLQAPVEEVLSPGDQTLKVAVSSGRRDVVASEFAISVAENDFPALATKRAILSGGVAVTPAQIELGSNGSSKRSTGISFQNIGRNDTTITVEPRALDGKPLEGVTLSPATFTIKAGRTKGIRATLRDAKTTAGASGVLAVIHSSENSERVELLPLAVLNGAAPEPKVRLGDLKWSDDVAGGAFTTEVSNQSNCYAPVLAELTVAGPSGAGVRLNDGYGRWLAPGESRRLRFPPTQPLPPGEYALSLKVFTREGLQPVELELNVVLQGAAKTASFESGDSPTPK